MRRNQEAHGGRKTERRGDDFSRLAGIGNELSFSGDNVLMNERSVEFEGRMWVLLTRCECKSVEP